MKPTILFILLSVYRKNAPHFSDEEREWLKKVTETSMFASVFHLNLDIVVDFLYLKI